MPECRLLAVGRCRCRHPPSRPRARRVGHPRDYQTEIRVNSQDEVGEFEQLFEQFRRVFVDLLEHVPELQKGA